MKTFPLILFLTIAIAIAFGASGQDMRGTGPLRISKGSSAFDSAQSVALFVGIRSFRDDASLQNVPYAVDDAVDLAYVFALDPRVALVRPNRVALALSDEAPRKEISKRRLAELKRKGARVVPATQSEILKLVNHQAGLAGNDGIFIATFATHGFSDDGAQYLLAANSLYSERDTAIPTARILDIIARSDASRSVILIDSCRERVRWQRSTTPEPRSAAPLIQQMGLTAGQVVFYGAAAGKWAYDDDVRQNGVFTAAVLDTLQCHGDHDRITGMVTIAELSAEVERTVRTWIRTNRDSTLQNATQASIDGAARTMPLSTCSRRPPAEPPALAPQSEPAPTAAAFKNPPLIRTLLAQCRADGETLGKLYGSRVPDDFVTSYVRWRDGCVAVLREFDTPVPQRTRQGRETVKFLSAANSWCATTCPTTLSPGNCALFRETPRAERCFWDLENAVRQIDDIVVRNPSVLRMQEFQ